jgi:peptidoglycan/LPS O-acetylase OafA/YrhL
LTKRFFNSYRRITSSTRFIPEIDGLRFVAIFSVYLYHLAGDVLRHSGPAYPATLASNGLFPITQVLNIGVPLFFVISGFILSLPFAESYRNLRGPVSLRHYFWRRVTRLEPPYVICLLVLFVLKIVLGKATASALLPHLMASIFYVHNSTFGRPSDIEFVAWSLEVEIQFYILAPLLAKLFGIARAYIRDWTLVTLVLLATALSRGVSHQPALKLSLLGYGQYFLAGFIVTELYLSTRNGRRSYRFWDFVSVAAAAMLLALLVWSEAMAEWMAPWLILLLFVAAFQGVIVRRVLVNPWLTTIGGMCYSIYLLHNYAIAALGMLTERLGANAPFELRLLIQLLLMSPFVVALGALYFRWIERPCMFPDWPQRMRAFFLRVDRQPAPTMRLR